jgi:hypothetical protein
MKIKGKQLEDTLRTASLPFTDIYATQVTSSLNGAVRFKCKNAEATALSKGEAVYISGVSGDIPLIMRADSDAAGEMPAVGLTASSANVNAEVYVVSFGNLTGLDTASLGTGIVGSSVYVDTTAGGLTVTPPTVSSAKLQNIGQIVREHGTEGIIKVGGAGRTAATPNLDQGKFFVGNASNQSSQSAYTLPTSDGASDQVLQTNGSGAVSFVTAKSASFIPFGYNEPLTDQTSVVEFTTMDGATNGQGWRMPVAGEITHVSLQADCVSAMGSAIFYILLFKNGSQVGSGLGTTVSSAVAFGNSFTLGTAISFSAGDRLMVKAYHNQTNITTTDHAILLRVVTDTY